MYLLEILLDPNLPEEVKEYYLNYNANHEGDAGIDLVLPKEYLVRPFEQVTFDFGIKCRMTHVDVKNETADSVSYTLHPRSSISKTPLMMKNSTGIIDSGYRGNIMAKVQNIPKVVYSNNKDDESSILQILGDAEDYKGKINTRLFQICSPTLGTIVVKVVDSLDETSRGSGGFGSTDANNLGVLEK